MTRTRRSGFALVVICLVQLMVVLDATIVTIALPYIGRDLAVSVADLQWVVTGYALTFGGLLMLGGRLGDMFGRRRAFVAGVAVFSAASLLGGSAPVVTVLLIARGLQGVGAALASPAALALITASFRAGSARNRALAVYAAMSGAGAAAGLILGGWLISLDGALGIAGWRLTFFINVPVALFAVLAAPQVLPESRGDLAKREWLGALTSVLGLLGIVYGLTRAGSPGDGWSNRWTLGSLVGGAVALGLFVLVESRAHEPLLPLRVFANRSRSVSLVGMSLLSAAMFALYFFLSLYIQNVLGCSPLTTGFAFLPFALGMILSSTIASRLLTRVAPRHIAGFGTSLVAIALFGMSRLPVPADPASLTRLAAGLPTGHEADYWTDILPFELMMSVGVGAVFVPLALTAVQGLPQQASGAASGLLNTVQQVGGALGLAVLGSIAAHYTTERAAGIRPQLTSMLTADASSKTAGTPLTPASSRKVTIDQLAQLGGLPGGATHAFLAGGVIMLVACVLLCILLDVTRTDLATDRPIQDEIPVPPCPGPPTPSTYRRVRTSTP